MNGTGIFLCNFSGMIKNVLPSLRQRAGPQRICSGTARDSFSQTPHMRGKVIVDLVLTERHRITPAHAGKSFRLRLLPSFGRDHPRVCGEKRLGIPCGVYGYGSPPHVRGKVPLRPSDDTREWDHPRVCGEKKSAIN